jgi:hypothetical protein
VRKKYSSDREKLLKFEAEGREFAKFLRCKCKKSFILFLGDLGEHQMRMRNFGESIYLFLGELGIKIS